MGILDSLYNYFNGNDRVRELNEKFGKYTEHCYACKYISNPRDSWPVCTADGELNGKCEGYFHYNSHIKIYNLSDDDLIYYRNQCGAFEWSRYL